MKKIFVVGVVAAAACNHGNRHGRRVYDELYFGVGGGHG